MAVLVIQMNAAHRNTFSRSTYLAVSLPILLVINLGPGRTRGQTLGIDQPVRALSSGIQAPNTAATERGPTTATATLEKQRAELAELGATNTTATDTAILQWLDGLLTHQLPKELQLEVLEAAGKHTAPAIKDKLAQYRAARMAEGRVATSAELLYGGDSGRGRKLFFEKPEVVCIKCHKIDKEGGDTGPLLTGALTNRTREFILESILLPNAGTTRGYEMATVILKDRSAHTGVIKGETETELTLACLPDEDSWESKTVTVKKSEIATRRKAPSPMPDGLDKTISARDLRDIIEFVASLNPENRDSKRLASADHK
jgi:quinoprotein glucose dehydrogenase